jgi:hypothetical protein
MSKPDPAADLSACVQALQDIIAKPDEAVTIAENAIAAIVARRMGVAYKAGRVSTPIPDMGIGGWAKWVWRVNDREKGGFAFEGPFLRCGAAHALPIGAIVLLVGTRDSRHQRPAAACTVSSGGDLAIAFQTRDSQWWKETKRWCAASLSRFDGNEISAPVPPPMPGEEAPADHDLV